jgi:hypothetical protein
VPHLRTRAVMPFAQNLNCTVIPSTRLDSACQTAAVLQHCSTTLHSARANVNNIACKEDLFLIIGADVPACTACSADKARPHWGKAWSRVYTSTACPVRGLFPASNWANQLALQQQYDPTKMFETEMLSTVIAGGAANPPAVAACTNEMSCYCNADANCGAAGLCCKAAPAALPAVKGKLCLPC